MNRIRDGFALFAAVLAVVLLGALIVAVHVSMGLERSATQGALLGQRADAAAEYGLWTEVAAWRPAHVELPVGARTTTSVPVLDDAATVTVVRLTDVVFQVASTATVAHGSRSATRAAALTLTVAADSSGTFRPRPLGRYSWIRLR